ncbi:MAG: hypothetical protein D9V44_08505 [Actinobacteria bacterium]|nr:MAG: hypothetical protein D9V44_08505 [Actinomycetota bacterium]
MSDNETGVVKAGPNKTVVALLAVVAVLLVAIVVIILVQKPAAAPVATAPTTGTGTTAMGGTPSAPAADVAFDKATATKVAAGVTPEEHVKAYFDALVKDDYKTAYALLPLDKKAAQDEATFASQLADYDVQKFTIDDAKVTDTGAEITATASMAGGDFQYLWTFVKDGDTWYVKSRTLPGMGG